MRKNSAPWGFVRDPTLHLIVHFLEILLSDSPEKNKAEDFIDLFDSICARNVIICSYFITESIFVFNDIWNFGSLW